MRRTSVETRVGTRIRARREALRLSQAKLAELAKVTPNYVGILERGEALPTIQTLFVFAKALGTSATQLLGEDEGHDEWLDRLIAVAQAVPPDQRSLVLALVHAVSTTPRDADAPNRPRRPARRRP